jgi:hypothetical protein
VGDFYRKLQIFIIHPFIGDFMPLPSLMTLSMFAITRNPLTSTQEQVELVLPGELANALSALRLIDAADTQQKFWKACFDRQWDVAQFYLYEATRNHQDLLANTGNVADILGNIDRFHDVGVIRFLIANHFNFMINERHYFHSAIYRAARNGLIAVLDMLKNEYPTANDIYTSDTLMVAVGNLQKNMVSYLLQGILSSDIIQPVLAAFNQVVSSSSFRSVTFGDHIANQDLAMNLKYTLENLNLTSEQQQTTKLTEIKVLLEERLNDLEYSSFRNPAPR